MQFHKKVLIVTIMLVFVASMGAASVSAQTSEAAATPTVKTVSSSAITAVRVDNPVVPNSVTTMGESSAVASTHIVGAMTVPTTFMLFSNTQSVKPGEKFTITGVLRAGKVGLTVPPPYYVYIRAKWEGLEKAIVYSVNTKNGIVQLDFALGPSLVGKTVTFQASFGNSYFASNYVFSVSNLVGIKCENTRSTPLLTTLYAYAPSQINRAGVSGSMEARLVVNGVDHPLVHQYLYIWKYSGKWVIVSRVITQSGSSAGWAGADYAKKEAGAYLYKFCYYGSSVVSRSESGAVWMKWY
jgi:hypothetical protein